LPHFLVIDNIVGLASVNLTQLPLKTVILYEITRERDDGHSAIQGNPTSPILVLVESPCATYY